VNVSFGRREGGDSSSSCCGTPSAKRFTGRWRLLFGQGGGFEQAGKYLGLGAERRSGGSQKVVAGARSSDMFKILDWPKNTAKRQGAGHDIVVCAVLTLLN
jgi:hypothetical protein